MGSGHAHHSLVLVDVNLDLSVYLTNFNLELDIFKEAGCSLAGWFNSGLNFVSVNGIIRLDLIHHLGPLQLVPHLQSWAFSIPGGLVPFGEVDSFSHADQSPSL